MEQYSEENANLRRRRANNGFGIIVEGLEKPQLKLGNCCQPVYGDNIKGYISKGSGIIVHRHNCPNMQKSEKERIIDISWDPDFTGKIFDTTLKISSIDKRNGVADMINALNSCNITIASVSSSKTKSGECITKVKLQVAKLEDLNNAIVNLNKLSEIYSIERVFK